MRIITKHIFLTAILLLISCSPIALTGKKQAPFWMLAAIPSNPTAGSVGTASSGNPAPLQG